MMTTRSDCEVCGADAVTTRYDEHNGWQPLCAIDAHQHDIARWAAEQGLTDPAEELAAAGIGHTVEHLGGNVVALHVSAGTHHVVRITADGVFDEPYMFALYDIDDDAEPVDGYLTGALSDVASIVADLVDDAEAREDAATARPLCDGCSYPLGAPAADGVTYCARCGHPNHVAEVQR